MKFQFDKVRMDSVNGHKLHKPIKYGWMLKLDNIEMLEVYHKTVHAKLIKKGFDDHLERIRYNRKNESNVTGHWSSNPAIVIDCLIGLELLSGNDVSLLNGLIKYEILLLRSKVDALNKGRILYLRRNGVSTPFGDGMVVEDTIIKDKLIYPQEETIQIIKWPNGKHYYAKIDDIDVPTGTALVLKNYYANEMSLNSTFLDDHGIKLNKGSKTNISDFNGYTVGKDFGNNISLNTQINGKVKINKRLT